MGIESPHRIENGRVEVVRHRTTTSSSCKRRIAGSRRIARTDNRAELVMVCGIADERSQSQGVADDQARIRRAVAILGGGAVINSAIPRYVRGPGYRPGGRGCSHQNSADGY